MPIQKWPTYLISPVKSKKEKGRINIGMTEKTFHKYEFSGNITRKIVPDQFHP